LGAVGKFLDEAKMAAIAYESMTWELATRKRIFRRLIRKRKGAYGTEALTSRTPSGSP